MGYVIWLLSGLWGMVLCFNIVADVFGNAIAFLSLLVAPALLGVAPIYALLANGDWLPLAVCYGGFFLGFGIQALIDD